MLGLNPSAEIDEKQLLLIGCRGGQNSPLMQVNLLSRRRGTSGTYSITSWLPGLEAFQLSMPFQLLMKSKMQKNTYFSCFKTHMLYLSCQ